MTALVGDRALLAGLAGLTGALTGIDFGEFGSEQEDLSGVVDPQQQ